MIKEYNPDLGKKIEILCLLAPGSKGAGMREQDFATELEIREDAWSKIKNGTRKISDASLRKLLQLFGLQDLDASVLKVDVNCFDKIIKERLNLYPFCKGIDVYKRKVVENFRYRRSLLHTIDISQNYYPLRLMPAHSSYREKTAEDAMQALHQKERNRLCILGPSGFGKTACLRRYLWEIQDLELVPFVLRLKSYAGMESVIDQGIESWFQRSILNYANADVRDMLTDLLAQRKGVFLIDGFDHLRSNIKLAGKVSNSLEEFFSGSTDCRVIISARTEADLLGRFANFEFLRVEPLAKEDFGKFLKKVGIRLPDDIEQQLSKLGQLSCPFIILVAACLASNHRPVPPIRNFSGFSTIYKLLDNAVDRLLLRESDADDIGAQQGMMSYVLRAIRKDVLYSILDNWEFSTRPCRVLEKDLDDYLTASLERFANEVSENFPDKESRFRFVVPTGILLEKSYELHEPDTYVFVHDRIQEFLYAKKLLQHTRERNPALFRKEYYSAEILELYGEALREDEVEILLDWINDSALDAMVRKVAAGALGFVATKSLKSMAIIGLRIAFLRKSDIGVDGRIAESLRRLGEESAISEFIERLDAYPQRIRGVDDPSRPLTFELDVQLERPFTGIDEHSLIEKLIKSKSAVTRKHALILLLRSENRPSPKTIVKYCINETIELSSAINSCDRNPDLDDYVERRNALIRSLRYGIEGLGRFGSDVEISLVQALWDRLPHGTQYPFLESLRSHMDEVRENHLKNRVWPQLVQMRDNDTDTVKDVTLFVIRHAESKSNKKQQLVGQGQDPGLSERGESQAEATANRLDELIPSELRSELIVITSTAPRSRETANAIAYKLGSELIEDPELQELDVGSWTGMTQRDIEESESSHFHCWKTDRWFCSPPYGETLFEVKTRVCGSLSRNLRDHMHTRTQFILVSHYFPIFALHSHICGDTEFRPDNCAISKYSWSATGWTLDVLNDTQHLRGTGFNPVDYV